MEPLAQGGVVRPPTPPPPAIYGPVSQDDETQAVSVVKWFIVLQGFLLSRYHCTLSVPLTDKLHDSGSIDNARQSIMPIAIYLSFVLSIKVKKFLGQ